MGGVGGGGGFIFVIPVGLLANRDAAMSLAGRRDGSPGSVLQMLFCH